MSANGNQELVYRAIAAGNALVGDIMHVTGLEEDTVRTCIFRLRDAERVHRESGIGGRGQRTRYVLTRNRCWLAECWR